MFSASTVACQIILRAEACRDTQTTNNATQFLRFYYLLALDSGMVFIYKVI